MAEEMEERGDMPTAYLFVQHEYDEKKSGIEPGSSSKEKSACKGLNYSTAKISHENEEINEGV
jgi:hypothetical protein